MQDTKNSHPSVAVVIPARNEERFIESCLKSLATQSYPADRLEIIVVDNGSTDSTVEIANKYASSVIEAPTLNLSELRNLGVEKSSGEILAFIDADCVADPDWIEQGVRSLQLEPCITGCFHGSPADGSWLEHAWFCQSPAGRVTVNHINTSNLFVHRELFEQLGGFDVSLTTGEDAEFSTRAALHVSVISDARIRVVHLGNPKDIFQFMKREIWHGLGAFGSFKHDRFDKPLLGTLGFLFFSSLQILALLFGFAGLYCWSTVAVLLLILMTLAYRFRAIKSFAHFLQLGFLYYLYYLARSIALIKLLYRQVVS